PVAPGPQGTARPPVRAPDQVDTIFIEKLGEPQRYWAGILVPLGHREHRHFPQGVLMIVADEDGSGVFFDPSPWIWYGVGLLGISALIWIPFVRSMTGRIKSLTRATEEISEGQFTVRPGTNHRDEVGRLSRAVDRMAERLDQHLLGQRRFLGDIAHELRSPIARMRMTLGILDQRLTELANRERVADVDEEAGELAKLVDEILAFSKASIRPEKIELEDIPLVDVIEPVLVREGEGGPVQMEVNGSLMVYANKTMLQRAFANVLRNALKYSGESGEVIVEAETEDDHVVLRVGDDGTGVPEEELARLTEPFYRPELARTREGGGFGLGLSIAKTCVESCGGTLTCRNRESGGFIVSIRVAKGEESG
ncbi:MAG: HAMP domain-containing sensor histidine kinase, partial [Verrucomicrobiota bacterium]